MSVGGRSNIPILTWVGADGNAFLRFFGAGNATGEHCRLVFPGQVATRELAQAGTPRRLDMATALADQWLRAYRGTLLQSLPTSALGRERSLVYCWANVNVGSISTSNRWWQKSFPANVTSRTAAGHDVEEMSKGHGRQTNSSSRGACPPRRADAGRFRRTYRRVCTHSRAARCCGRCRLSPDPRRSRSASADVCALCARPFARLAARGVVPLGPCVQELEAG